MVKSTHVQVYHIIASISHNRDTNSDTTLNICHDNHSRPRMIVQRQHRNGGIVIVINWPSFIQLLIAHWTYWTVFNNSLRAKCTNNERNFENINLARH